MQFSNSEIFKIFSILMSGLSSLVFLIIILGYFFIIGTIPTIVWILFGISLLPIFILTIHMIYTLKFKKL